MIYIKLLSRLSQGCKKNNKTEDILCFIAIFYLIWELKIIFIKSVFPLKNRCNIYLVSSDKNLYCLFFGLWLVLFSKRAYLPTRTIKYLANYHMVGLRRHFDDSCSFYIHLVSSILS